jgi:hypothetical protein
LIFFGFLYICIKQGLVSGFAHGKSCQVLTSPISTA